MSNPKFKLDDNSPTVSWADPRNAESSASSQVCSCFQFCSEITSEETSLSDQKLIFCNAHALALIAIIEASNSIKYPPLCL